MPVSCWNRKGGAGTVVNADSRAVEVKFDRGVHVMFQRGEELALLSASSKTSAKPGSPPCARDHLAEWTLKMASIWESQCLTTLPYNFRSDQQ